MLPWYRIRSRLRPRNLVYALAFLAAVSVLYLHSPLRQRDAPFDETLLSDLLKVPGHFRHPVEQLHLRAEGQFGALRSRQSRTPQQASAEYRKRYGRDPPPHFEEWVDYALQRKSPIIDDFDMIDQAVAPFYKLTPVEFRHLMAQAAQPHANTKARLCQFVGGKFLKQDGCRKEYLKNTMNQLGKASKRIPDLTVMFNFWDEPSVLVTEEKNDDPLIQWTDKGWKNMSQTLAKACELGQYPKKDVATFRDPMSVSTFNLSFVTDISASKDLCRHPEYNEQHGFVHSPVTFRHMPVRVPLLSQAVPFPFNDIPIPPGPYSSSVRRDWNSWKRKKNAVYWAGATTGGRITQANPDAWRKSHRQRLTLYAMQQDGQPPEHTYLSRTGPSGLYEPHASTHFNASLYNVKITRLVGCEGTPCDAQDAAFGPFRETGEGEPFKYRLVFDLDGNSYTGRYYRFLASGSVPLKMTLFREWHDERLIPWLHYVPVSVSMEELPELVHFLVEDPSGQRIAERIAEAGSKWFYEALTSVHQGVYLYRLFLELAWLQDESRTITPSS